MIKPADKVEFLQEDYLLNKIQEINDLNLNGANILNIATEVSNLKTPIPFTETFTTDLKKQNNNYYQSSRGIPELRFAFSEWYRNYYSVYLNPDTDILAFAGCSEAIMDISMAFLNYGDQVLVPNPGNTAYGNASKLAGAEALEYNLNECNNYYPDFVELEKLDLKKVKIMWVNYPHMPTGQAATLEVFAELVAFGQKHNILICNDNIYSFVLNDEPLSIFTIGGAKNVALELNSISKSHNLTGLKTAMIAGAKGYVKSILKIKSTTNSEMYKPNQLLAVSALQCDVNWYNSINAEYRNRRELVWEIFDLIGATYCKKQIGMFVWAKINKPNTDSYTVSNEILDKVNVFIVPGAIFGSNGSQFLQISLCTNEDTLKQAIQRLKTSN